MASIHQAKSSWPYSFNVYSVQGPFNISPTPAFYPLPTRAFPEKYKNYSR